MLYSVSGRVGAQWCFRIFGKVITVVFERTPRARRRGKKKPGLQVAERTAGFSGRQISKFVTGLQSAVYGSGADTVRTQVGQALRAWT